MCDKGDLRNSPAIRATRTGLCHMLRTMPLEFVPTDAPEARTLWGVDSKIEPSMISDRRPDADDGPDAQRSYTRSPFTPELTDPSLGVRLITLIAVVIPFLGVV